MRVDSVEVTVVGLRRVVVLAEELGRSNLSKLSFDEKAWHAAVAAFGILQEPLVPADARVSGLVRRAKNIVRRLGNAGEARFGSYSVGRAPDSSTAGKRFHRDLKCQC
jgi:hypothetical protein